MRRRARSNAADPARHARDDGRDAAAPGSSRFRRREGSRAATIPPRRRVVPRAAIFIIGKFSHRVYADSRDSRPLGCPRGAGPVKKKMRVKEMLERFHKNILILCVFAVLAIRSTGIGATEVRTCFFPRPATRTRRRRSSSVAHRRSGERIAATTSAAKVQLPPKRVPKNRNPAQEDDARGITQRSVGVRPFSNTRISHSP